MSRVFLTGDFHGGIDCHKLTTKKFPVQEDLTKDDIVIILGDAGFVWNGREDDKYWQKWISKKNFTTFCVVGNHENYDLIKEYPIVDFCGGKARKITDSLYYEIRGEVYSFNGKTFLSCGGAESTDKELRKEGVSWWAAESITLDEVHGICKKVKEVDYIITHTCPTDISAAMGYNPSTSNFCLSELFENVKHKHHYCGHYHRDETIFDTTVLYNDVIEL